MIKREQKPFNAPQKKKKKKRYTVRVFPASKQAFGCDHAGNHDWSIYK